MFLEAIDPTSWMRRVTLEVIARRNHLRSYVRWSIGVVNVNWNYFGPRWGWDEIFGVDFCCCCCCCCGCCCCFFDVDRSWWSFWVGVFVGLFFVDVEFATGGHLRKVDSYVRIFNTGCGFGKASTEACLLEVWGCFIFLQPWELFNEIMLMVSIPGSIEAR